MWTAADNHIQKDPAVIQHTTQSNQYATLDVYNPFDTNQGPPPAYQSQPAVQPSPAPPPPAPAVQPPKKQSPAEPKNYGSYGTQEVTAAATAELLKRQEELERKAAELDRRERELQSAALGSTASRQNNWPPLPKFCPVQPCFYQDIGVEIPQGFQKTVTCMYYLWIFNAGSLMLNMLTCFAWLCVSAEGTDFGLSILWALLFTPCSYVCWFRPLYKAFRSDSSFNFFAFFFIFCVQDVVFVLSAIGIPHWGYSGWILALTALKTNIGVAVIMMVTATFFSTSAILGILMLQRVHSLYRRTGASFQKAQEEFATGVFSNKTVQTAAANAAASAAAGATQGAFQPH
ncbi:secretory carrier-associated membrane protein 3 isoform X2 [Protopterus annectens]|uniref:secretory carrier-associated membrane protein 3 isoform X2 n=1 Tax=Protopterus annectens TaxID=7888 RepID=UPI001CFC3D8A|nr:secretory carrier-associated membrane protein 3 isoform X2 [Protopterus annectens]